MSAIFPNFGHLSLFQHHIMLHASIVHFPIALLVVAGGLYCWSVIRQESQKPYEQMAFLLHVLGLLGAIAAVITGGIVEESTAQSPAIHEHIERHELMGYACVWGFALLGVWRFLRTRNGKAAMSKPESWAFAGVFVGFLVVLLLTAHIGGDMVYEHGAGVEPMQEIIKQQLPKR